MAGARLHRDGASTKARVCLHLDSWARGPSTERRPGYPITRLNHAMTPRPWCRSPLESWEGGHDLSRVSSVGAA